jgi:penicillin-binding protein 2
MPTYFCFSLLLYASILRRAIPLHLLIVTALCYFAAPGQLLSQSMPEGIVLDNTGVVENPKPTWETQLQARTFQLHIPAPRGQIVDRNGHALALNRISYNLAISFPTPLDWKDTQVLDFARQQITLARQLLGRDIPMDESAILRHYTNRGLLPYDIAEDLSPRELGIAMKGLTPNLILRQTYLRYYPKGRLAAHLIGYVGRVAPLSTRPIENKDLIFPDSEGREGLEKIFNEMLVGIPGVLHITFDPMGRKMSERIARQPVPGNNLITTIDYRLQEICEKVLEKNAKRGAIAVIEVGTGEILALASWPTFNPNIFVPTISAADFAALQNNPSVPLYPRAFRSAYPPGSTFKIITGLAALQSGAITPEQRFNCPPSLQIGNFVFRNWKKESAGSLNFKEAMAQSCNTYFYQVGLKTGSRPIVEWAQRMGIGRRTGLPIEAESAGNMPTDEYMLRVHKRKILPGDLANLSIGQGDILITPLQMAQAMGILAARGSFFQTRLVKQIQSLDNRVIAAYPNRLRDQLPITPENLEAIRDALVAVTESGTGGRARVKGIKVAGKTGTAQWGPKERQRTAAWFAGFLPADEPKFAFAAVYEGDPNVKVGGGSHAAPLIGKTFAEYWPMVANLYAPQKNASPPSQKEENETSVDEEPPPELDESN